MNYYETFFGPGPKPTPTPQQQLSHFSCFYLTRQNTAKYYDITCNLNLKLQPDELLHVLSSLF